MASRTVGNILPDSTAAPSLQGQQRELEKHMRADSLNEKIAHRPTPAELIKEGILDGMLPTAGSYSVMTGIHCEQIADEDPTKAD